MNNKLSFIADLGDLVNIDDKLYFKGIKIINNEGWIHYFQVNDDGIDWNS